MLLNRVLQLALFTMTSFCLVENAPTCETGAVHGSLFVALDEDGETGTELNVFEAGLSRTSAPEFTKMATLTHPSAITLSKEGVSNLQHEGVLQTSTRVVTLTREAVVIFDSQGGPDQLISIDAACEPHRLYARNPEDAIYVLCADRSRMLKLTNDSSGAYELTEIERDLAGAVNSPAVALLHQQQVAAVVLKHHTDPYPYNRIELTLNIEIDNGRTVCEDAYEIDTLCDSPEDRLLPFDDSHVILECKNSGQQFLLDISSLDCFEKTGFTSLGLQQGAMGTAVGPDKDLFVVHYGTSVYVQSNGFTQSYTCDAGLPILGFDYAITNYIVLFTVGGTFRCHLGVVTKLSPLTIGDHSVPYFVEGRHLFLTSTSSAAIQVIDVENACQVEFGPVSSVSTPPGTLELFAFVEGPPEQPLSTPTVTHLSTTTPTATLSAVTPPTEPSPPSYTVFYLAALAVLVISSVVMGIVLAVCVVTLYRKHRQSKLRTSPEHGVEQNRSASVTSNGSTTTSISSGVQESGDSPPHFSINCTSGLSRELHLTSPIEEVYPVIQHALACWPRSPVPPELYLIEAVEESGQYFRRSPATRV